MADNALSRPLGGARQANWTDFLAQAAFTGFLFLVFVGLQPFASRANVAEQLLASGEGDLARQISYVIIFLIIIGFAFAIRGQRALRAFPVPLLVVLLWCLVSVAWAIEPDIAARRLLLAVILVSCVMCGVDMLGSQRSLQALRFVMAVVLIVNCVSVWIIPQAIHLPGEFEGELAGNWRGLYFHKNIAGPIAALSALLFFHYGLATRRWRDWLLFAAAVVFMIGTQSKTAIGFFLASIVISTTYRQMGRTEMGRHIFTVLFVGMLVLATMAWFAYYETIADLMSDPTGFTGRVAIWQTVFTYLRDHWLLGAGFGSFWQVGEASPALSVAYEKWVQLVPHSHNGYLEIFVTTGVIGLFISIIAFIIIPIKQLLGPNDSDVDLKSLLFSLVCFFIFANLLETIFLNRDRPEWVIFLIVLAILHRISAKGVAISELSVIGEQRWRRTSPSSRS